MDQLAWRLLFTYAFLIPSVVAGLLDSSLNSVSSGSVVESVELISNSALGLSPNFTQVCRRIGNVLSSASNVYYPGDTLYEKGISHLSSSSSQQSKCVIEPGTADDVGKILDILGDTRTPFAIKGGGHASNPGFSSTPGIHISMYRFSVIQYHPESNTVDLGAGLIWDDVYAELDRFGVGVVGARDTGVGVAGFLLGGGYSYTTNQYGFGVDNIVTFELVLPNGQVTIVTNTSNPDLFFGLRGGQNNFGIVTKFTVKTYPQGKIWGGDILYGVSDIPAITAAAVAFQETTDPKAALIMHYVYVNPLGPLISLNLFYDAPTPPPGLFDMFLDVPMISKDIGTRDFLSMMLTTPTNRTNGARRYTGGMPAISFTSEMADVLLNETIFWGKVLTEKNMTTVTYIAEISGSLPSIFDDNTDRTAYPPIRNIPFQPWSLAYTWLSAEFDVDFHDAVVSSTAHVRQAAIAQGQSVINAPVSPNHAILGTPLEDMYGRNLPELHALKQRVDPTGLMGLAGGWKF